MGSLHYHTDENGREVRCYHTTVNAFRKAFAWTLVQLLLMTVSFPVEHYVWTHVPAFASLAKAMNIPMAASWPRITER